MYGDSNGYDGRVYFESTVSDNVESDTCHFCGDEFAEAAKVYIVAGIHRDWFCDGCARGAVEGFYAVNLKPCGDVP